MGEYDDLWTHFYGPSINGARPPAFEEHILSYFEIPLEGWYKNFRTIEIDYPVERYVSITAFEKNLRRFVRYIKDNDSDVILVTQPSLYKLAMSKNELERLY